MVSTYWATEALRRLYKEDASAEFYVGLSSTMPSVDGSNVHEPTGGNYTRVPIASTLDTPSNGKVTNAKSIEFPMSTSAWFNEENKAAYYVIFDGKDHSAHVLGAGEFYTPMVVEENCRLIIAAGLLEISVV